MTKRLSVLSFLAFSAFAAFAIFCALPASATSYLDPDDLEAGDLIRGQSYSAVYYYGEDGFRYVFPNFNTYSTWYSDFDDVKWLTDSDLSTIQIGGNVTYKPGVRMIKILSIPKVYAISSGGTLRHVATEAIATELYGANWNKMIDDMPDGFFSNYTTGSAIDIAGSFDVDAEEADAFSINSDKGLTAYTTVTISDNGYSDEEVVIEAGETARFVNAGTSKHTASADDGSWGTGTLTTGQHFTRRFKEAGTYEYHCAYDDDFSGTIEVE
jgi:plastocyanin